MHEGLALTEWQVVKIIYRYQLPPQTGQIGPVSAEVSDVLRPCVQVLANGAEVLILGLKQETFGVALDDAGLQRMRDLRSAGVIIVDTRPGLKRSPSLDGAGPKLARLIDIIRSPA